MPLSRGHWSPAAYPLSWISAQARHFRIFWSLDLLWIFQVGQATFKYWRALQSETTKTTSTLQACSFFWILAWKSWNSASQPQFLVQHLVPHLCPSIWHFENFKPSVWNTKYSEKGVLPEHFVGTFPVVTQEKTWLPGHTKLMTSLIMNLPLAVFYRQLRLCLPLAVFYRQWPFCEVIDKSQENLNSSKSKVFPSGSVPSLVDFNWAVIFRSFHLDFLFANFAEPTTSYHLFSNFRCASLMICPGNCSPAPSNYHFSKPPPRVIVTVCISGHSYRSGSFVFETLVGTRTLHP